MLNNSTLDSKVIGNFITVKLWLLIPLFLFIIVVISLIISKEGFINHSYIEIQKDSFFYLNSRLSQLPKLQFNLTQLGDVLIFLPLLGVFIIYAPKLWEALITSLLLSAVLSASLKKLFAYPRPAAVFDNDSFVIIGETLRGNTSLPSGHSIAAFTIITVLLFAFMPKKITYKVAWSVFIITIGLIIAFSRVGVGAHYPLDVVFGSAIGYFCAVIGIFVNNKFKWKNWTKNKNFLPVFILFLIICAFVISKRLLNNNLIVYYISLLSIAVTLYLIIRNYVVKKEY